MTSRNHTDPTQRKDGIIIHVSINEVSLGNGNYNYVNNLNF